jgi:hypothetical protein
MGMYTELHFNAELKKDTPEDVIAILNYMLNREVSDGAVQNCDLSHELFACDRWDFMLRCDSYYFSSDTKSTLRFDDISKSYFLCIKSNLKNYSGEIEKFIDWIHPYLDEFDGDYLGHYRYEEDSCPRLIFKNKVIMVTEGMRDNAPVVWEMENE